ncbi:MAG: hypothetical protein FJ290_26965 [Planctomycetes bacterium]|nr:hypothetical protein [Planctomycetota bacterium]
MRAWHTCSMVVGPMLAAILAGCAVPVTRSPEDWPWGRTRRGLQSRIVFEKHVYQQGEPVVCWVEVRNASGKPVPYDGRVVAWRTAAGTKGEVCWRIASDDAPFARALRAIFDEETRKFLREQRY